MTAEEDDPEQESRVRNLEWRREVAPDLFLTPARSLVTSDPEKEQLLAVIEQAFSGVRLEDGVSANMAEYHDSGGTKSRYLELARSDERDDWRKVGDTTLEQCSVTLCFTDLKGFRFYVPAYMQYAVRNHDLSDSPIVNATIYALSPDHHLFKRVPFEQWFTCEQIRAITMFLEYCVAHSDTLDGVVARKNLERIRQRIGPTEVSG